MSVIIGFQCLTKEQRFYRLPSIQPFLSLFFSLFFFLAPSFSRRFLPVYSYFYYSPRLDYFSLYNIFFSNTCVVWGIFAQPTTTSATSLSLNPAFTYFASNQITKLDSFLLGCYGSTTNSWLIAIYTTVILPSTYI